MKKHFLAMLLLLAFGQLALAQSSAKILNYIEQYKAIAMEEMQRTGVPASITLAQGIHETGAGTSVLVTKSNNHFGIKCKTEWTGDRVYHDDDARGECFRKYDDPYQSYKDHSDFLKYRPHYASLFKLDPLDYKGWAHGLKKAGYATNPKYPQILIKLIEDYKLQDYTLIAMNAKDPGENKVIWASNTTEALSETEQLAKVEAKDLKQLYPTGIFRINDTKVVLVEKGTSFLKVAGEHNLSLSKLFDFNDMAEEDIAAQDRLVFLQRKRKTGDKAFHVAEAGETAYDIAQSQGIRLESLIEYNGVAAHSPLKAGEKIYLQEKAPQRVEAPAQQLVYHQAAQPQETFITHTVQTKETAYSISKKYGVSVENILQWNNLSSADLRIGQELRIKTNR